MDSLRYLARVADQFNNLCDYLEQDSFVSEACQWSRLEYYCTFYQSLSVVDVQVCVAQLRSENMQKEQLNYLIASLKRALDLFEIHREQINQMSVYKVWSDYMDMMYYSVKKELRIEEKRISGQMDFLRHERNDYDEFTRMKEREWAEWKEKRDRFNAERSAHYASTEHLGNTNYYKEIWTQIVKLLEIIDSYYAKTDEFRYIELSVAAQIHEEFGDEIFKKIDPLEYCHFLNLCSSVEIEPIKKVQFYQLLGKISDRIQLNHSVDQSKHWEEVVLGKLRIKRAVFDRKRYFTKEEREGKRGYFARIERLFA